MSTRSRILLALLALTLAPLLCVALWACVHAVRWSPEAIQLRLARATVQGALDVRARHAGAVASLEVLAEHVALTRSPDSAVLAELFAGAPEAERFAAVRVMDGGGDVLFRHVSPIDETGPSCSHGSAATVEAPAGALRLVAELRPDQLLERRSVRDGAVPRLVVVGTADGAVVTDPWCVAAAGQLPPGAQDVRSPQSWSATLDDAGLAVIGLPAPDWPAPFPDAGLGLLLAAVFCALAAAGAFVILVRELWRSMDILTSAADRIGQGDFSPWLPPPAHDEVGRLSFAIGTMAARLEQVMQQAARSRQMAAIGELASHISHEIRNPLSSIKLNLQSVEREMRDGSVPTDLPAVMQLCLREVHRLDGTVHGVLRLAATREPQMVPCRLHAILEDAVATVAPQFEAGGRGIELIAAAGSDGIRADIAQLRGVVLNLLLNAYDALPAGGRLEIRTELADETLVRARFTDDGPGVRPEDRERVFQPFFTTKPSGTGIGLPLASRTVEAHGGRLYLERRSELETGAEFVLELPLEAVVEQDDPPAPAPARTARRDARIEPARPRRAREPVA